MYQQNVTCNATKLLCHHVVNVCDELILGGSYFLYATGTTLLNSLVSHTLSFEVNWGGTTFNIVTRFPCTNI